MTTEYLKRFSCQAEGCDRTAHYFVARTLCFVHATIRAAHWQSEEDLAAVREGLAAVTAATPEEHRAREVRMCLDDIERYSKYAAVAEARARDNGVTDAQITAAQLQGTLSDGRGV